MAMLSSSVGTSYRFDGVCECFSRQTCVCLFSPLYEHLVDVFDRAEHVYNIDVDLGPGCGLEMCVL